MEVFFCLFALKHDVRYLLKFLLEFFTNKPLMPIEANALLKIS